MPVDAGFVALPIATPPEGTGEQSRNLGAAQMTFTRAGLSGKGHGNGTIELSLPPTPPNCSTQDDEFSARSGHLDGLARAAHAGVSLCGSPPHVFNARRARDLRHRPIRKEVYELANRAAD
jgi:hypothetical protein